MWYKRLNKSPSHPWIFLLFEWKGIIFNFPGKLSYLIKLFSFILNNGEGSNMIGTPKTQHYFHALHLGLSSLYSNQSIFYVGFPFFLG